MVAVALELEHAVDEVLEHARAGDGAVLRHVADEDRRDALLLRDAQEPRRPPRAPARRSRAPSRARPSRASAPSRSRRRRAARCSSVAQTVVELGLGEDLDVAPRRRGASARSFTWATDSSPVTSSARRPSRAIAPSAHQEQRRLADARLAADEDERRRHEPAAEHAVELGDPGGDPRGLARPARRRGEAAARAAGACCSLSRACNSSTSVPKEPQPGHRPSQRPADVPHSEQTNWTTTLAMEPV